MEFGAVTQGNCLSEGKQRFAGTGADAALVRHGNSRRCAAGKRHGAIQRERVLHVELAAGHIHRALFPDSQAVSVHRAAGNIDPAGRALVRRQRLFCLSVSTDIFDVRNLDEAGIRQIQRAAADSDVILDIPVLGHVHGAFLDSHMTVEIVKLAVDGQRAAALLGKSRALNLGRFIERQRTRDGVHMSAGIFSTNSQGSAVSDIEIRGRISVEQKETAAGFGNRSISINPGRSILDFDGIP